MSIGFRVIGKGLCCGAAAAEVKNRNDRERFAAKLADSVRYISLHHYANAAMDYTMPDMIT